MNHGKTCGLGNAWTRGRETHESGTLSREFFYKAIMGTEEKYMPKNPGKKKD